jgi:hypothetical protein
MQQCGLNRFCCIGNSTSCDCNTATLFELDPASFVTTLPLSTMLSTTSRPPASPSATAISSSIPASPSASNLSSEQSSNHSVAIGAGIGAGVGVPLLAAVGVLAWYLRRRQKSREMGPGQEATQPTEELKDGTNVGCQPMDSVTPMGSVTELPAEKLYEMDAVKESQEMDGIAKNRRGR